METRDSRARTLFQRFALAIHVTARQVEWLRVRLTLRVFFHLEEKAFEEIGPARARFRTREERGPPALRYAL